jgi:hypothetical protein
VFFQDNDGQLTFGYTVPMIADHEISLPTYTTMDDEASTGIILVLKEVKFLEFLAFSAVRLQCFCPVFRIN